MIKIGSHVPFTKPDYLVSAAATSVANGANAMMIYLGSPHSVIRNPDAWKITEYKALYGAKIPSENIVIHAPYIINPASTSKWQFAAKVLADEAEYMNLIRAKYLVLHPGSHVETAPEVARKTLINTLKRALSLSKDVTFLIETMAGKGTEIGTTLEEIAATINSINDERIGVCLDTCHLFDAGYDLTNNYEAFISKLKTLNLLDLVKVIHVNDTKFPLGSRKDRHENIGKGAIGTATLRRFVHDPLFATVIKILETPAPDGPEIYGTEIKLLLAQ